MSRARGGSCIVGPWERHSQPARIIEAEPKPRRTVAEEQWIGPMPPPDLTKSRKHKRNGWPAAVAWLEKLGHTVQVMKGYKGPTGGAYAVAAVGSGFLKIGSAKHFRNRIESLQTPCPHPLAVVALISGYNEYADGCHELDLHRDLAAFRMRGEWFRDCDEVRSHLKQATEKAGGVWVVSCAR
ncbi:MAG: GIY-YIG nuclease family protein [Polyangiaceae bacterium]